MSYGHPPPDGLTRVLEFGAREPQMGLVRFLDETHDKHTLRNKIVAIERAYRGQWSAIVSTEIDDRIFALKSQLDDLDKEVKASRGLAAYTTIIYGRMRHRLADLLAEARDAIASRQSKVPKEIKYRQIPVLLDNDPDASEKLRVEIAAVRKELKPLYDAAKLRRKEMQLKYAAELEQLDSEREAAVKAAVKAAVAVNGIHWMNYEEVRKDYDTSRIAVMKDGVQLTFHSWEYAGKIDIRYQKGRAASTLFEPDTRLTIAPMNPLAWTGSQSQRRKHNHTEVKIRCGSDAEGKPRWVVFTAYIHRPLPPDCRIQGASLVRRRVGLRYEYKFLITVRCPVPKRTVRKARISVNLDWKRLDDGSLQAGSWSDSSGNAGAIVLPKEVVNGFESLPGLEKLQDGYRNLAKNGILALDVSKPDWFQHETRTLAQWESPKRFLWLWKRWKDLRFAGDETAFDTLSQFRERFLHLYPWESNLRDRLQRRRREIYRVFASAVAAKYGAVAIDTRRLVSAGGGQYDTNMRHWTKMAAASVLRSTLQNTAKREGLTVIAGISSQIDISPTQKQEDPVSATRKRESRAVAA